MGWSGTDIRKGARIAFECLVIVKKKETSIVFRTHTENVSNEGVCVILEKGLLKNTPVEIELFLPDDPIPVTCGGRIAWSARRGEYVNRKPLQFDTGIEFIDIGEEDKAHLRRIVTELLEY